MSLEVIPVRIPVGDGYAESALVVRREDGLAGLGEAPAAGGRNGSLAALVAALRQGRAGTAAARFALETAALDLEGRRRGVPVSSLLGGARRRSIELTWLVTAARADAVARQVERAAEAGYSAFKLKSSAASALDLERLGAARWAAGRGSRLRLDLNGGPTIRDTSGALARIRALAPFRLELVEQPLPAATEPETWLRLAAESGQPVAADESLADAGLARRLAGAGVGLAIKLATVGGAAAALELAAGSTGPLTIGSSLETSIGIAAAVHAAAALATEPLACGLATTFLMEEDPAFGLRFRDGYVEVPDGPGLGIEIDPAAVAAYRVEM